jgi:hypothetical protein
MGIGHDQARRVRRLFVHEDGAFRVGGYIGLQMHDQAGKDE